MKQVLQHLGSGETLLADVPCPAPSSGHLLIESTCSLVSLGTEKMLLDFGRGGWISKARQQPDKVKQVIAKIKTDGLFSTLDAVKAKLDQPIPLGYCNVGIVREGGSVDSPSGARVVSNGHHAEIVNVPNNLAANIPDGVSDEEAAFTVVGAIGLQGIRLLNPTLGESIVVTGLGLIGLLCVQMLRANGCRVLGIDIDSEKCALARQFGAETVDLSRGESPLARAESFTGGSGVDGVLITASSRGNEIISEAAGMCRQRGRIVLVGVVGLDIKRADFYEKELSFQVSCSYGPGRHDPSYEGKGLDYPIGFVRWTEQRNFQAVLQLMADGNLSVAPLVSHRVPFEDALQAYDDVARGEGLGILLKYPERDGKFDRSIPLTRSKVSRREGSTPVVGFLGAGNFATRMLIPHLQERGIRLKTVVSETGISGSHAARKFGFQESSTDADALIKDDAINAVFIATRHNSHAEYALRALKAGKHVFVEKPLCLTLEELTAIEHAATAKNLNLNLNLNLNPNPNSNEKENEPPPILMVDFNRRFSPHMVALRSALEAKKQPASFVMTVNAGAIPGDHWTQDPEIGGGRIVGEACHFIDLLRFLAGAAIVEARLDRLGGESGKLGDVAGIHLGFADGSIGSVHYLSNGHRSYPKERLEVFCGGSVFTCHNFRTTEAVGAPSFSKVKTRKQDKGHSGAINAFIDAIEHGECAPIPLEEIFEVSRAVLQITKD